MPYSALYLTWIDPVKGVAVRMPLQGVIRIGSAQENDIVLTTPGIEPFHAEVRVIPGGGYEVSAIGSSAVMMGDRKVDKERLLPGASFTASVVAFALVFAEKPLAPKAPAFATGAWSAPAPSQTPAVVGGLFALIGVGALGATFFFLLPYLKGRPKPAAESAASPVSRAATPTAVPVPADPLRDVKKAVVTVIGKLSFEKGFSTGTGLFVDPIGRVVTNYHVIAKTDYQQVLLPGSKKPVDARILGYDEDLDLALLQAYVRPPVPVAPLARDVRLKMGDPIYALGSPSGPTLEVSLTRGIVSSDMARKLGGRAMIQHDAAVNPGNSGGPLIDQHGLVVGINTMKIKDTTGLSFAIPIDDVRVFLETAAN